MVDGSGDPTTTWKFDPADITVPAGSTVTWKNTGQQPHTITADDGSFTSDYVSPGGTWQHTFATAGTYAYHCTPHPWMKAVVHVTGGGTPAAPGGQTPTTQAAAASGSAATSTTATTSRTAAQVGSSTTTTTAAAGGSTTTTTAAATGGTTTTVTSAAANSGAPSAASATDVSTTTSTGPAPDESAASSRGHGAGRTDTPLVVLAGVVTVLLMALTLRLLSAKS
jgi:hypothetical protein